MKGRLNMSKDKAKQQGKKQINPSDIKGKIEIPDKRERKDGPGGN